MNRNHGAVWLNGYTGVWHFEGGSMVASNAPNLVATSPLSGARVLVIDDVLTTGASVERATAALLGAGASTVHAAVCARTADVSLENPTDGVLEQHRWSA